MTNRICQIQLRDRILTPAEAEIWVTVLPEHVTPGTELRGRLTGPRCAFATTVEVAYPLRPLARPAEGPPGLTQRVVIPEPSWWDPVSPFLYDGTIELWQDGRRCDAVQVRHGFRSFRFDTPRLQINGRLFTLNGTDGETVSADEALRLRQAGRNTFLVPVRDDSRGVWDLADRLGFLVLGRLSSTGEVTAAAAIAEGHPSCLGWLLEQDVRAPWAPRPSKTCVGVALHRVPETLPEGLQFILCEETLLPSLTNIALPKLIRTEAGEARVRELLAVPGVWGIVSARRG